MTYALGVDIGGTKVAAAILNQKGEFIQRSEVPSETTDREKMFGQVAGCIDDVVARSAISYKDIDGMGVGVPGKVDCSNGVAVFQNNLPWRDFPLVERLRQTFPIEHVVLDNDVHMAAYAEWKLSGLGDDGTFVYMTISTGISCAIIHNGSFVRGRGFAGEVGLLPVPNSLAKGEMATLEELSSGTAIGKIARRCFQNPDITTKDLFMKYESGNQQAIDMVKEIAAPLASGIYSIVALLDPQYIVFGGGVMNHNPYLLEMIQDAMKGYLIDEQLHVPDGMQLSRLKGDAGIVGAGMQAMKQSLFKEKIGEYIGL